MKWIYYRFIYRWLMKLAHRYNWHHTRTCYPDGDTLIVCDWCGLRYVERRRGFSDGHPQRQLRGEAIGVEMNQHNLDAINELYKMPPKESGIKENFYWAVHGNWPAIREMLKRQFAAGGEGNEA